MGKKAWIWITVVSGFLFLLLVGGLIIAFVSAVEEAGGSGVMRDWDEEIVKEGGHDRILLLHVDGVIMPGIADTAFGAAGTSSDEMLAQLDQAMEDDTLKGIIVRVNSPGGDVVASDEIYRKLLQVKEETNLPLVFSFGSTAASGGYYIATAGDKIVSNPLTVTGSIGVIMSSYNYRELADKVGVKEVIIKSGDLKDIGSGMREMTEEEKNVLQSVVNDSFDRFIEVIATGRDLTEEKVRDLADGRIYTGQQAKELALVDELGTLEDAIGVTEEMAGIHNATVVRYAERFNFSSLFRVASQQMSGRQVQSVAEMLEMKPPGLMYLYTTD